MDEEEEMEYWWDPSEYWEDPEDPCLYEDTNALAEPTL